MGITFAILRACGNSPAEKEQFIISASGVAIDTLPIYILNQNYNFSQPCVFIIKENEIRTIITSILIPSVPVFKGFITDLFVTSSDLLISLAVCLTLRYSYIEIIMIFSFYRPITS